MRMTFGIHAPRPLDWGLIAASLAAGALTFAFSDWHGGLFVENGPVEIAQFGLLAAATLLFARASLRLDEWAGLATLTLACLCELMFLRETPRCNSPFYEFGPCIDAELKTLFYVASALPALALLALNPGLRSIRRGLVARLFHFVPRLLPLLVLVPPAVLSQVAERYGLAAAEELLELAFYLMLVLFGLRAAQAGDSLDPAAAGHAAQHGCRVKP